MNQVKIERIKAISQKQKCESPKCGDYAEWRVDVKMIGRTVTRYAHAFCCSKHKSEYYDTAKSMRYDL